MSNTVTNAPSTCPLCGGINGLSPEGVPWPQAFIEGFFLGMMVTRMTPSRAHLFLCPSHLAAGRKMATFIAEQAPHLATHFCKEMNLGLALVEDERDAP